MRRTTPLPTSFAADVPPALKWAHWICFVSFLIALAWAGARNFLSSSEGPGVPEAALLLTSTATTLVSLWRRLPAQNVLLAAAVAGLIGNIAQGCGTLGLPLGFADATLTSTASFVWVPALWMIILFNARGVAQLVLWHRQNASTYGYWLLTLTTLLALVFVIGFETFAAFALGWSRAKGYGFHLTGFAITTALIAILVTPALINKKPVVFSPDYHPLLVWALLNLLFAVVAVVHFNQS